MENNIKGNGKMVNKMDIGIYINSKGISKKGLWENGKRL